MSKLHPIKETVKVLYITKPNQKIRFQIRHPENVYAITGIAVTCSLAARGKSKEGTGANAGLLNLAIAEKGDVAYTEDVKADTNNYLDFTEGQTFTMTIAKGISSEGRRLTYFETEYKITDAIMEGYYEDTFLSAYGYVMDVQAALAVAFPVRGNVVILPSTEISPIKEDQLYKVTVYIRYSTIKPEEK